MTTVMALDNLDPMTADQAGFAVALAVPAPLSMVEDSVVLEFGAKRGETGETQGGEYVLVETRDGQDRTVYRLPPLGVADIRAVQHDATTWASAGDNELSIGVTFDFCRTSEIPVPDDLKFSIFIQLAQDATMLPLVRNGLVTEVIDADALNELESCVSS
jgi:hypothetical protein